MGCGSCGVGGCGTKPAGCGSKGSCLTGGCGKLNAFDWLSNMDLPETKKFDVVEIRFKAGRKEFFRNDAQIELFTGDLVVVDGSPGFHVGYVSLQGELVRLQMRKKKVKNDQKIPSIIRKANQEDLDKLEEARNREMTTMYRSREIIREYKLAMKLSDVEIQADGKKATFYYSADKRVDFRELIKSLASEFKLRVDMRQISLRQEASRLGGIGSCGRELCCSTWLTDFKSVTTSAARYQNLSLNPAKLSGQCGRLKCCLNYELDTYLDALVDIPEVKKPLETLKGKAILQKTDIFRKLMWFSYEGESTWHEVSAERVSYVMQSNAQGIKPDTLAEQVEKPRAAPEKSMFELQLDKNAPRRAKGAARSGAKGKPRPNRKPKDAAAKAKDPNKPKDPVKAKAQPGQKPRRKGSGQHSRPQGEGQQPQQGPQPRKKSPQEGGQKPKPKKPRSPRPENSQGAANDKPRSEQTAKPRRKKRPPRPPKQQPPKTE